MALSSNIQTKSSVTCFIGTEVTMGTATLAGGTWNKAPLMDFSFSDDSAGLTVAPFRTDSFGQPLSGGKHLNEDRVSEVSLTMKGTAATINRICHALFGDFDGTNDLIGSLPDVKQYKHGVANAIPVTLLFDDAGMNGNDIYFTSCLCTSMELSYGIDSDGGMLKCVANFTTGYKPAQGTLTPDASTDMGNAVAFNIHDLTTHTYDSQDLLIKDFSLSISRSVTKAGANPDSNYNPFGYAIGGYEVTGSITCKRDENVDGILDNDSAGQVLALSDGTFQIDAPKCMVDGASPSFDDSGFSSSIPFRCFYDDASISNSIVKITTA